jgi:hypothetical protein
MVAKWATDLKIPMIEPFTQLFVEVYERITYGKEVGKVADVAAAAVWTRSVGWLPVEGGVGMCVGGSYCLILQSIGQAELLGGEKAICSVPLCDLGLCGR